MRGINKAVGMVGWDRAEAARVRAWEENVGADRRYSRALWRKLEKMKVEEEFGVRFQFRGEPRDYNYFNLARNRSCKLLAPSDFTSFEAWASIFLNDIHEITTHYGRWVLDGYGYAVFYSHEGELKVCGSGTTRWGVPAVLADQAFSWRLFQEALSHMDENDGELKTGWCYSLRDNVAV